MAIFQKRGDYYIDYYADGRRVREKVGPSLRLARLAEMKRKMEIAEGKYLPGKAREAMTFAAMADLYWELHAKQKPSAHVTIYLLRQLKAGFGEKRLDQITIPDVMTYLNAVRERTTASTANRQHSVLRAIFNRAIEWDKFMGRNPAARVKEFRVENARTRFLEKGEIGRLLAACDAELHPVVVCALMTGMRQGEILKLRWEHVDLTNGTIYVLDTKSGKPREIPIAPPLHQVLSAMPRGDGGLIFRMGARYLARHFAAALRLVGIADFRFHDLRHTFASHYVMRTNDLPATQKLLGHHSPRMTQRYAHLSKGHLRVGMETFSAGMDTIWTPAAAPKPGDPQSKTGTLSGPRRETTSGEWSGRAESNCRLYVGNVAFYH